MHTVHQDPGMKTCVAAPLHPEGRQGPGDHQQESLASLQARKKRRTDVPVETLSRQLWKETALKRTGEDGRGAEKERPAVAVTEKEGQETTSQSHRGSLADWTLSTSWTLLVSMDKEVC